MTQQTTTPTARHDGWTAERRTQFLDDLALHGNVRVACARVGLSREAAYRLKRRDAQFARVWAAAQVLARAASAAVVADRAIEGIEEDVWYRGEVVGTRRRYDNRLLLAHMARLDALAGDTDAEADAARFEELLAGVAGVVVPAELADLDEALPMARERFIDLMAQAAAEAATAHEEYERGPDEDYAGQAAEAEARLEAAVRWDGWFADACATVDRLLDRSAAGAEIDARTPSTMSTSSGAATFIGPDGLPYARA